MIACLKDDSLTDPQRKKEIEKLINPIGSDTFTGLVQAGKGITDFLADDGAGNEKLDDELGVAVVFDEEEDDDEAQVAERRPSSRARPPPPPPAHRMPEEDDPKTRARNRRAQPPRATAARDPRA